MVVLVELDVGFRRSVCRFGRSRGGFGKFGYGQENDRGERLLNFCLNNNFVITNTMFAHKKC